jgi:transposase
MSYALHPNRLGGCYNWASQTVRGVLHKWEKFGIESLWEKPGRGGKAKWKEEDIEFLEEALKKEPRTYNSFQLADKLEKERSIKLSPDRLRRVLKKRGLFGKELVQVIKENKTPKNEKLSQTYICWN